MNPHCSLLLDTGEMLRTENAYDDFSRIVSRVVIKIASFYDVSATDTLAVRGHMKCQKSLSSYPLPCLLRLLPHPACCQPDHSSVPCTCLTHNRCALLWLWTCCPKDA
jgi:hypothetical protein